MSTSPKTQTNPLRDLILEPYRLDDKIISLNSNESLRYSNYRVGDYTLGKSKRGAKEFTKEQRLIQENRVLKRQVASLRKQFARVDLDRYGQVREIIEEHYQEDRAQEGQDILEKLKSEWKCLEPDCNGYLEIFLFNKIDNTWYFRKCNSCNHRTKSQKYSPDVKGILKKSE